MLLKKLINLLFTKKNSGLKVSFHVSGVGMLSSCFAIQKIIVENKPDLIIQAGIAGTFDEEATLGKVVTVKEEILADTGVEENDNFQDLFDMNLANKDLPPFSNKRLINSHLDKINYLQLEQITGITVNEVTTRLERIKQYKVKYNPVTETMEGASLHYCCLQTSTPFIQIRAISNYIGERDKSKWNFSNSLKNLSDTVLLYVEHLCKINQF